MLKKILLSALMTGLISQVAIAAAPETSSNNANGNSTAMATPAYKSKMAPLKANATKEEVLAFIKKMEIEAEKGDLDAQYGMGTVYRRGDAGWPQDDSKSVEWYKKAAEQGHRASQNSLGIMYLGGTGVEASEGKAVEWFKKAAAQKSPEAMQSLAVIYMRQEDKPENKKEVPVLLSEAANLGSPASQLLYSYVLEDGQLVERNPQEAYKWSLLAATQQVPGAKKMLAKLSNELSAEQVDAAGASAKSWLANFLKNNKK